MSRVGAEDHLRPQNRLEFSVGVVVSAREEDEVDQAKYAGDTGAENYQFGAKYSKEDALTARRSGI